MAYSAGTATDRQQLMTLLVAFLTANGWIVDFNAVSTTGRLSIHKNNVFIHFANDSVIRTAPSGWGLGTFTDNMVVAAQSTSYNSGNSANYFNHPGTLVTSFADADRSEMGQLGANIPYEFHTGSGGDPSYVYIVCKPVGDTYVHMMFGEISKITSFNGGEFLMSTGWSFYSQSGQNYPSTTHKTFLKSDGGGGTPASMRMADVTLSPSSMLSLDSSSFVPSNIIGNGTVAFYGLGLGYSGHILSAGKVKASGVNVLVNVPIIINLNPANASNDWQRLGEIPNLRYCSMEGRSPGENVINGADTWIYYPFYRKGAVRSSIDNTLSGGTTYTTEGGSSWNAGFAIKKVP
jgi:hypothetical protein